MEKEEIIEKLNETKEANVLYKISETPNTYSEKEIEDVVGDLIDESLKLEGI